MYRSTCKIAALPRASLTDLPTVPLRFVPSIATTPFYGVLVPRATPTRLLRGTAKGSSFSRRGTGNFRAGSSLDCVRLSRPSRTQSDATLFALLRHSLIPPASLSRPSLSLSLSHTSTSAPTFGLAHSHLPALSPRPKAYCCSFSPLAPLCCLQIRMRRRRNPSLPPYLCREIAFWLRHLHADSTAQPSWGPQPARARTR